MLEYETSEAWHEIEDEVVVHQIAAVLLQAIHVVRGEERAHLLRVVLTELFSLRWKTQSLKVGSARRSTFDLGTTAAGSAENNAAKSSMRAERANMVGISARKFLLD